MTYKSLNAEEEHTYKARASYPFPKTQIEALKRFQLVQLRKHYYQPRLTDERGQLKKIIQAQKLIDELEFCPSI